MAVLPVGYHQLLRRWLMRFLGMLALATAVATALLAFGESNPVPLGGDLDSLDFLLLNESVQKELKLSDEQLLKVKEVIHDVRQKHRPEMEKLRDRLKLLETMRASGEEVLKKMDGILTAEQIKRFKQIRLQKDGLRAFSDKEVEAALRLTEEQKSRIKALTEELSQRAKQTLEEGTGSNFESALRKLAALRKDLLQKAVDGLTAEQKKAWKELTGEPFEIRYVSPAGRREPSKAESTSKGDKK
jgi:hypothetical protein